MLEDIHWSDASTLDWLAHVARRPEPARLMMLATFRPADAAAIRPGLSGITSELALHGRCHEIALAPLDLEAIEAYLAARLGDDSAVAHPRDDRARCCWSAPAAIRCSWSASSISWRSRMPRRPARCDPARRAALHRPADRRASRCRDRDLLCAASVIRREFATAARRRRARHATWSTRSKPPARGWRGKACSSSSPAPAPGRTARPTELYAFRHDLYRELLYERLSATRRALSHARVGARLEAAWATRPDAIAAEIAEHFERGNELGARHPASSARRRQGAAAQRQPGGDRPSAARARRHRAYCGRNRAHQGRSRAAGGDGRGLHGDRGFGAPRGARGLCAGRGAVRPPGRARRHVPGALGAMAVPLGPQRDGCTPGGSASGCWRSRKNPATPGSSCKRITRCGRPRSGAESSHKAVRTRRPVSRSTRPEVHQAMASSYGNHDAAACARYFIAAGAGARWRRGARPRDDRLDARDRARTSMIRSRWR